MSFSFGFNAALCDSLFGAPCEGSVGEPATIDPNAEPVYIVGSEIVDGGERIRYVYSDGKSVTAPVNDPLYIEQIERERIMLARDAAEATLGRSPEYMTAATGKAVAYTSPLLLGGSVTTTIVVLLAAAVIMYVAVKR